MTARAHPVQSYCKCAFAYVFVQCVCVRVLYWKCVRAVCDCTIPGFYKFIVHARTHTAYYICDVFWSSFLFSVFLQLNLWSDLNVCIQCISGSYSIPSSLPTFFLSFIHSFSFCILCFCFLHLLLCDLLCCSSVSHHNIPLIELSLRN